MHVREESLSHGRLTHPPCDVGFSGLPCPCTPGCGRGAFNLATFKQQATACLDNRVLFSAFLASNPVPSPHFKMCSTQRAPYLAPAARLPLLGLCRSNTLRLLATCLALPLALGAAQTCIGSAHRGKRHAQPGPAASRCAAVVHNHSFHS